MKRFCFIIILTVGLYQTGKTQNYPLSDQYLVNKFYLSPSFAGVNDGIDLFSNYRDQWSRFPGAPVTKMIDFNTPLMKNVGIGASVISDKSDIFNNFYGSLSYAYHLRLGTKQFVSFSLTGTLIENTIDFSKISAEDPLIDPVLESKQKYNELAFNAGASIVYRLDGFHAGLTIPYIIRNKTEYGYDNNLDEYMVQRLFIFHSSWNIKFSNDWSVEPFFVGRKYEYAPFNFDITGIIKYKDNYWIGGGYRNSKDILFTAGFKLNDVALLSYTYEYGNNLIASNSNGTHDITIGFIIGKDYKKNKEEMLKKQKIFEQATKTFEFELDEQKKENESLKMNVDSLYKHLYAAEKEINNLKTEQSNLTQAQEEERQAKVIKKNEEKNKPEKGKKGKVKPKQKGEQAVIGEFYVVVEGFSSKENAQKSMKGWTDKGFKPTIVYNKVRDKYYITVGKFKNKAAAVGLRDSLSDKVSGCWIYQLLPLKK